MRTVIKGFYIIEIGISRIRLSKRGAFSDSIEVRVAYMPAVVMTREEHRAFTNRWREAIGYNSKNVSNNLTITKSAETDQIREAAQKIYKDYPDILEAINVYFDSIKK